MREVAGKERNETMPSGTKSDKYGEGPREQYGEGSQYRTEDKTPPADDMGKNEGFGATGGAHEKGATSRKMGEQSDDGKMSKPDRNTGVTPSSRKAKGGLPEEQPPKQKT